MGRLILPLQEVQQEALELADNGVFVGDAQALDLLGYMRHIDGSPNPVPEMRSLVLGPRIEISIVFGHP
jgi:hypothetical protein